MCGLCGIIPLREMDVKDIQDEMTTLLMMNEVRGTDATGIFRGGKNPSILKCNCPSEDFVDTKEYKEFFTEDTVYIAHTRAATVGEPEDYHNNHPINIGDWVITHNGSIKNDVPINIPGDVDSRWFAWALNKYNPKNIIDFGAVLSSVCGSYGLVAYQLANKTTYIIKDDKSARDIYYRRTKDYIRYSQVPDAGMDKFVGDFQLLIINNGKVYQGKINPEAPYWLIKKVKDMEADDVETFKKLLIKELLK